MILWAWAYPSSRDWVEDTFPIPHGLERRVQFWIDIFAKYSSTEKIIHDAEKPERIYRTVDFNDMLSYSVITKEKAESFIESEKRKVISVLNKLASENVDVENLSENELRIYRLFGKNPSVVTIRQAVQQVRIQGGMREAFLEGIVRSGRYLSEIRKILDKHDLPQELAYLPHIESSFHPHARSVAGAVGIWQFTRGTGRQYMKIGRAVDERRDPILSTEAAARHLKANYAELGSWPLAITAYNRGLGGMQRAVNKMQTKDLGTLVHKYQSRRFGFACKNFYLEFIAAAWIAQNTEKYFGPIQLEPPMKFKTVRLPVHFPLDSVLTEFNVSAHELRKLNPALLSSIFQKEREIPRGYRLRIPLTEDVIARTEATDEKVSQ